VSKQTGPDAGVKGGRMTALAAAAFTLLLSGCGTGGWSHPTRNPGQQAADERLCNREAEDMALARAGSDRTIYGQPPISSGGYTPGESPMQMKERSDTERRFQQLYGRCMEAKGYVHDDSL